MEVNDTYDNAFDCFSRSMICHLKLLLKLCSYNATKLSLHLAGGIVIDARRKLSLVEW